MDIEAWIDAYGPSVFRLALSYLRHRQEAEDVFQEVFLRAHLHGGRLREAQAARPWLLRVTANLCRDRLRSWPWRHLCVGEAGRLHQRRLLHMAGALMGDQAYGRPWAAWGVVGGTRCFWRWPRGGRAHTPMRR